MNKKILILGPPRCGKSTLISKLIEYFSAQNYSIYGFQTPEIREHGNRIGFDIIDINSGEKSQLARVGTFNSRYKLGKYNVFIKEFDKFIEKALNFEKKQVDLIIIDEIGKMELFSEKFQNLIMKLFTSQSSILATVGLKLNHQVKNFILNLPSIQLLNLNRQNFQFIFEKVIYLLS
ncbi:MAG: NTPase [Promethearchaeota archaeon]